MMTIDETTSRISAILKPHENNPRSSEGDFLRLRDGRILFAYSAYHGASWGDDEYSDIRALYSSDNGETFSPCTEDGEPRILISAAAYGEKNVMSVSLLRMENGDLGLFYILKKQEDHTDEYLLSRSRDEGETFYETVSVLPGDWKGYYVINNARVERMSDGRLVVPAAHHDVSQRADGYGYDGRSNVVFYCSDDDGHTWFRLRSRLDMPALNGCNTGLQEPGVIELPNGDWYAYMRTDRGYQYEALSPDRGEHWFGPQPSAFSAPASPMELVKNPYSGKYYAVWNPIPNYNGRHDPNGAVWGRTPLAIAESADGYNYDFGHIQYIEDDPARGYCYPALFFADEHTLLAAYCSGGGGEEAGCLQRLTIRRIRL